MRAGHFLILVASACSVATAAAAAEPQAKAFITDAIKGDNSEIMLGDMAAKSGASAGVRDFGKMLSTDHGRARTDAVQVARTLGAPDTREMKPQARAESQKLAKMQGAAFDREFANYMVKDHQKDIAAYQKAAKDGGPAAEHAKRILPDLQKHLTEAQRLASAK